MTAPEAKWGVFKWSDALWGAGVPSSAAGETQGSVGQSLRSTVYLGADADVDTDESQYATNLTATTKGGYETSSARGAITYPRTIYVDNTFQIGTAASDTLAYHGNAGKTDYTFLIWIDGSGDIAFGQNGSTLLTVPNANFTSGVDQVKIQWGTRANPDTTGAGDAMISEVVIHSAGNDERHIEQFTHAVATTDASWTLSFGGYWDGAAMQEEPVTAITRCRLDGAYYSNVHFESHWGTQRTGAVTETEERLEPTAPTKASGIGDQNEYTGPQFAYLNAHLREAYYRFLSPLVNDCYYSTVEDLDNAYAPTGWHYKPPGQTVYRWHIAFLRWCTVPENCNYLQTRIFAKTVVSSGAAVPVGFRIYSFSRVPVIGKKGWDGQEPPPYEASFIEEKIEIDHTGDSNGGDWVCQDLLRIVRPKSEHSKYRNTTFLCIAYAIDPDAESANDANCTANILAWSATPVPFFKDNGGGGGGGGGMGWGG